MIKNKFPEEEIKELFTVWIEHCWVEDIEKLSLNGRWIGTKGIWIWKCSECHACKVKNAQDVVLYAKHQNSGLFFEKPNCNPTLRNLARKVEAKLDPS